MSYNPKKININLHAQETSDAPRKAGVANFKHFQIKFKMNEFRADLMA